MILTISLLFLLVFVSSQSRDFAMIQLSFAQNQTTSNVEYNVYNNSTLGIKIDVPSSWLYKEDTQVLFISPPSPSQSQSPLQAQSSNNNGVSNNEEGAPTTAVSTLGIGLENASNSNQSALSQLAINTIKESLSNFQLDRSNTTTIANTLAGNPSNEIVFTGKTSSGNEAKGLLVWTEKGSILYTINYSAVSRDKSSAGVEFEKQLPTVRHMIESFEITSPSNISTKQ